MVSFHIDSIGVYVNNGGGGSGTGAKVAVVSLIDNIGMYVYCCTLNLRMIDKEP